MAVYSGREFNSKFRLPNGEYSFKLIKLTNARAIHRDCDYNLYDNTPKRIDDPLPWTDEGCSSGGIHFVKGYENVSQWLYYDSDIGHMKRAFFIEIPNEDNVKVAIFNSEGKIKASSVIIIKEISLSDLEKRRTEEESQARRNLVSILEECYGKTFNLSRISSSKLLEALEAIKEYGSVDKVPIDDERSRFINTPDREEFWEVNRSIAEKMAWFNSRVSLYRDSSGPSFGLIPKEKRVVEKYREYFSKLPYYDEINNLMKGGFNRNGLIDVIRANRSKIASIVNYNASA